MNKTKIITIALLSILILSAFITIANTNVSAEEDIATYSCSGQVAMAHWEVRNCKKIKCNYLGFIM
jgi:hypothetical protein